MAQEVTKEAAILQLVLQIHRGGKERTGAPWYKVHNKEQAR